MRAAICMGPVEVLLRHSGDLHARNLEGRTALDLALAKLEEKRENGAKPDELEDYKKKVIKVLREAEQGGST